MFIFFLFERRFVLLDDKFFVFIISRNILNSNLEFFNIYVINVYVLIRGLGREID